MNQTTKENSPLPWYRQVTRYQWLVLLIASLGWVFDIFEGQVFVVTMNEMMPELVGKFEVHPNQIKKWKDKVLEGVHGVFDDGMKKDKEPVSSQSR